MKTFFILVLFFLVFILVASSSLAGVDLTPDTPPAQGSAIILQTDEPQVIMIQDATQASPVTQSDQAIPVTGSCAHPYTVRSGDSLSAIAVFCNTTTGAIRLANPQITNINLIYPGQKLVIPGTTSAIPEIPVTGDKGLPVSTTQVTPIAIPTPTQSSIVPNTGATLRIASGTRLRVQALNYPANRAINIALQDESSGGQTILGSGVTDPQGSLVTEVDLPDQPSGGGPWSVVVYTTGEPKTQAASLPFLILPR
jgi:LysM repeat protein